MLPSERLKKLPNAQAELIQANAFKIIVKITPPAPENSTEPSKLLMTKEENQRKRKAKILSQQQYYFPRTSN